MENEITLNLLSFVDQEIKNQSASTGAASESGLEFYQLLTSLFLSSTSETGMFSGAWGSGMSTDMLSLLEQLLQQNFQTESSDLSGQSVHINQFAAEISVGGDGANANCGPTSLTIALHALGLKVAGETASTSSGQAVDLARKSMAVDASKDGVDSSGNRIESEHSTFTNFAELKRGARAAGAAVRDINPSASTIQTALESGAKVIISGTFVGKSPLPWTGDRGSDNQSAPGGATAHIVAVTGYDAQSGTFTVNDPARNTVIQVDAETLQYFMQGNAGAIAISR
jgi:hypothetical protein